VKSILVPYSIPREGLKALFDQFDVTYIEEQTTDPEILASLITQHHGLVAVARVDQNVIDSAPNLEVISNYGVGYDNIDINYATKRNVVVANTPNSTTQPTAELAMGLMISLVRGIADCDRRLREDSEFRWGLMNNMGRTLYGKTLGIVGLGRIGKAVTSLALPFGMKVIYNNRNRLTSDMEEQLGVSYRTLQELLEEADVISLHNPMTADTRHLIGENQLKLMKTSAVIINTSRGPVIDEEALISALETNQIAGAGLDVYEHEPDIPPGLLQLSNVVLTPHIGTDTYEARVAMAQEASQNIIQYFNGQPVTNRVN